MQGTLSVHNTWGRRGLTKRKVGSEFRKETSEIGDGSTIFARLKKTKNERKEGSLSRTSPLTPFWFGRGGGTKNPAGRQGEDAKNIHSHSAGIKGRNGLPEKRIGKAGIFEKTGSTSHVKTETLLQLFRRGISLR